MKRLNLEPLLPIIGVVGLIAVWYLAVLSEIVDPILLPPPTTTFRAMWNGMLHGKLGGDFLKTVERTAFATVIANWSVSGRCDVWKLAGRCASATASLLLPAAQNHASPASRRAASMA